MITPELKDTVLSFLMKDGVHCSFNIKSSQKLFGADQYQIELIINQLIDYRFITADKMIGGTISTKLTAYAYDFVRKGGFVAEDAIEKAALEKLQLELEALKKTFPESAELFTSTLANIATVASFFISR